MRCLDGRFDYWGRIGFDRVVRSVGGVPWLVSWPRKKLTKNLVADANLAMAA
jgi:hypothetical protein